MPERKWKGMAKDLLGIAPTSLLNFDRDERQRSIVNDNDRPVISEAAKGGNYEYSELTFTEFSPALAEFAYKFYLTDIPQANIYDPFAGRATRGIVASLNGHNYTGIDVGAKTIADNIAKVEQLEKQRAVAQLPAMPKPRYICADSTNQRLAEIEGLQLQSYDFAFTCPPYWNLEEYGNSEYNDLSNCSTYEEFLRRMQTATYTTFSLLKFGSFYVFVANYFRKEGKFLHLARDLVRLAEQVGFVWYDEIVLQLRSGRAIRSLGQNFGRFQTAKAHEYMEVLYKPGEGE